MTMKEICDLMEYLAVNSCTDAEIKIRNAPHGEEPMATVEFVDDNGKHHVVRCHAACCDYGSAIDDLLLRSRAELVPCSLSFVVEEAKKLTRHVELSDPAERQRIRIYLETLISFAKDVLEDVAALEKVIALNAND